MRPYGRHHSGLLKGILSFGIALLGTRFVSAQIAQNVQSITVAAPVISTAVSTLVQTFQTKQQILSGGLQSLVLQGATFDQIQAWVQQNATAIAAQQKLAQQISASQSPQPIAYVTNVDIPGDASQTIEEFLTDRANLLNLRAQLYNQQLQSTGTVDEDKVETAFEHQNAVTLQSQTQRFQGLAQESAQQPLPIPPALELPAGATPQMQAFLTLRDQIMRESVQIYNQNLSLVGAAQETALEQWHQQNAARFAQLQIMAQNLTSTTQN